MNTLNIEVDKKRVIVRMDLDFEVQDSDLDLRLKATLPILQYLIDHNASSITIIGHKGRPGKEKSLDLSLKKLVPVLENQIGRKVVFIDDLGKIKQTIEEFKNEKVFLLENLRFDPREEENSDAFADELAKDSDIYINEAFASSHREHTSIVGLPKAIKENGGQVAFGFRFLEEVEKLKSLREDPKRPFVALVSGVKKDKLSYLESFLAIADKVVLAGRLPVYVNPDYGETEIVDDTKILELAKDPKVYVSGLNQDREDITLSSIEKIEEIVSSAKTILVSGPIGKFEDQGHKLGTMRVLEAVANSSSYKVAAGGDTEEALVQFVVNEKFDWVSVGGGACLEFLSKGTLPGIEAIKVSA